MNLVSIILDSIIILFVDFFVNILAFIGFGIDIEITTYIYIPIIFCIAIAINTMIEGYIALVYFKKINRKRLYFYIFLANTLSAAIDMGGIVIRTLI